jgi:hypothetical protein
MQSISTEVTRSIDFASYRIVNALKLDSSDRALHARAKEKKHDEKPDG